MRNCSTHVQQLATNWKLTPALRDHLRNSTAPRSNSVIAPSSRFCMESDFLAPLSPQSLPPTVPNKIPPDIPRCLALGLQRPIDLILGRRAPSLARLRLIRTYFPI